MDYRKLADEMKANGLRDGNPFGSVAEIKQKHSWRIPVLTALLSCVVTMAIAVPITWKIVANSQRSGSSSTDGGLSYAKSLAKYYYPNAIEELTTEEKAVADIFYSFNSADEGFLTFALHTPESGSITIFDGLGEIWHTSVEPYSYISIHKMQITFSWSAVINGSSTDLLSVSLNLTPFFKTA
jgi:hypothetical protein